MNVESWTGGVRPLASGCETGLAIRQIIYGGIVEGNNSLANHVRRVCELVKTRLICCVFVKVRSEV